MIKYNFIDKYRDIQRWKPPQSEPIQVQANNSSTSISFLLNKFSLKFPEFSKLLFLNKILYLPSLTILSFILLLEIFSIPPRLNILFLSSKHYRYVDTANQMSDINRTLEEGYKTLIDYSQLIAANSPSSHFAYYLQTSTPNTLQLSSYTVDNKGFKLNAMAADLDSVNQFISQLIMIKFIDSNSLRLLRLTSQPSNPTEGNYSQEPTGSVNIELSGTWLPINLEDRIIYNKSSKNLGMVSKLSLQKTLLDLFDMTQQ